MKHRIPYLKKENNRYSLMVEDEPFMILGGELHNSSASDLSYMKEHVWPGLKRLEGNCYLVPVYWECMEPEQGKYDFTLVDGLIAQAREADVHLVLLWFGLWKNGKSEYTPHWFKINPEYFYMVEENGKKVESVSPLCHQAVELDRRAYVELLSHLREVDEERTVIMIQVENETGIWNSPRDYSEVANAEYKKCIPEDMARLYGVNGTWEEVFGRDAPENFMSYYFSHAVEKIAAAGKKVYPIPTFMNCVDFGFPARAGQLPSGAPIPRVQKIWRCFAPSIDMYGPDIYAPDYRGISAAYAGTDHVLVIPEMAQDKNVASKALFTIAAYNTICFSPFGIEGLMTPLSETDLLSQTNSDLVRPEPEAGVLLSEVYGILNYLRKNIQKAQDEHRIYAFLEQGNPSEEFVLDEYILRVSYGDGGMRGHMGQGGHRSENNPIGGGFIIQTKKDTFFLCGISCNLEIQPKYASQEEIFILDKREYKWQDGCIVMGRIMNGDERNYTAIGGIPGMFEITMYRK